MIENNQEHGTIFAAGIFTAGFWFATGLGIAGMTDASKVIGFFDLSGSWDPSLAFVLMAALAVHGMLFRFILKRTSPVFAPQFYIPTRKDIDSRLILGAALFGIGWGLSGYCPGPAITATASLATDALVFTAAMLAGMFVFRWSKI